MKGVNHVFSYKPSKNIVSLLGWMIVVSVFFSLSSAFAAKSFKVGIVDPQKVIEKTKAGKRALATLKEHADIRQKLIKSQEEELKTLQDNLQNAKGLSEAETQAMQQQFQAKFQEYQKRGQEFQQELAQKQRDMVLEYMKKIEVATKAVAERHGFSLVVDKGSDATLKIVLYSQRGLDITNEVVKEFDRRYK